MIIDTHVHTGIFEDIDRIVNMSEEIVLEAMQLYHIDRAAFLLKICERGTNFYDNKTK